MAAPAKRSHAKVVEFHDETQNAQVADHSSRAPKRSRQQFAEERRNLPIHAARDYLVHLIKHERNVIIVGETGSGKTTQIPQYLHEAGFTKNGMMIGITQPRRVAAITVSKRVADETGTELGTLVGYSIRFDDVTSASTRLKYLTDGMLLRESMLDPLLSNYSVIILDEAHERTLHTDILFGVVKGIQRKRKDLKVILMSATLQAEKFSKYFNDAQIVYVKGRQYPVDILYPSEPQTDYLDSAMVTALQLHLAQPLPGDILVFLTGQDEIETLFALLRDRIERLPPTAPKLLVTPIYAALPSHEQLRVFEATPQGTRKVILATNIAETSITINGVKFVIDTGVVKVRKFAATTGMDCLAVMPVSKAEAMQRSGRAGRQQPGQCYRLYTEDTFQSLKEDIVPEVLRCNLASVVLLLKALHVEDILTFDFLDRPPQAALVRALEHLYLLGALTDKGTLAQPLGTQMAAFPLEPMYSKALLASGELGCAEEMLSLMALLSADSVFFTPRETDRAQKHSDKAVPSKAKFASADGDHLTLLNVYASYLEYSHTVNHHQRKVHQWCVDNCVSAKSMKKVLDVREQLYRMYSSLQLPCVSCGTNMEPLKRALVAGFFLHAARLQPDGTYRTMFYNQIVNFHPSSVLAQRHPKPETVVYNEIVLTNRQYMRDVTVVELAWLAEAAPKLYASLTNGVVGVAAPTAVRAVSASGPNRLSGNLVQRLSKMQSAPLAAAAPIAAAVKPAVGGAGAAKGGNHKPRQ